MCKKWILQIIKYNYFILADKYFSSHCGCGESRLEWRHRRDWNSNQTFGHRLWVLLVRLETSKNWKSWKRIETLFHESLRKSSSQRLNFLQRSRRRIGKFVFIEDLNTWNPINRYNRIPHIFISTVWKLIIIWWLCCSLHLNTYMLGVDLLSTSTTKLPLSIRK